MVHSVRHGVERSRHATVEKQLIYVKLVRSRIPFRPGERRRTRERLIKRQFVRFNCHNSGSGTLNLTVISFFQLRGLTAPHGARESDPICRIACIPINPGL
jgi:hypothetical protein